MNDIECPVVKSDSTCYWKDMWRKLDRMRQVSQLTDVSLMTTDKSIFMAHSPVLAASSNFFHNLLIRQSSGNYEQATRNLFLNNIDSDVLKVTLDFIYGITPSTRQSFEQLQIGAKELGIIGAYEYCSNHLKKMNALMPCYQKEKDINNSNSNSVGKSITICTCCSVELPCCSRVAESDNGFPIPTISLSELQSGNENLAAAVAEASASIADWSVSMSESNLIEQRINGNAQNCKVYNSINFTTGKQNCSGNLDVTDEMPSDDIHTTAFTQMSLGDLTAGIRCPHIKGIMGENNPMETFLVEDELVDNIFKEPRSPQDAGSDSGDVPKGIVSQIPPKKRKRLSKDINGQPPAASLSHNSNSDKIAETSHLQNLVVNDSICSKDIQRYDANEQNFDMQICASISSGCSNSSSHKVNVSLEKQMNESKSRRETTVLKTVREYKDSAGIFVKELDNVNQSPLRDLLPSHGSLLYPCISTINQHHQLLNKSSYSVGNSIFTTSCDISTTAACNGSFHQSGIQQTCETAWKESNIWNHDLESRPDLEVPVAFLSLRKSSFCESTSNIDSNSSYSQSRESALDSVAVTSCCETNISCKSKIFSTLKNISHQFENELCSKNLTNICSAISLENGEMFNFSVSESPLETVSNCIMRNHSSEISPSVLETSTSLSNTADGAFKRGEIKANSAEIEQIHCHSLSSDAKEEINPSTLKKYCCNICGKVFKSASRLSIHHRHVHLQHDIASHSTSSRYEAIHQCQYCQEFFKSSYKLQTHQLKAHSRGKLFSCKDCNFRSPRKKDVQAHMLSQHGFAPSGVKVYCCANCNYKCIDRNRFEEHEAKHTGITSHCCPLCNRAYTTKRGMRTHLKYHSEERPHKCNLCGAGFKVTSKLSDHMKLIHLQKGVKPYKCGYCDHATALRGNCNQHIRKNHPGQPLLVIDKFASQRKCVKDYDYAGMAGDGIKEFQNLETVRTSTRSNKVS